MTSIKNIRSEATAFTDEPPDLRAELDASNMIREVFGWAIPTKENAVCLRIKQTEVSLSGGRLLSTSQTHLTFLKPHCEAADQHRKTCPVPGRLCIKF